MSKCMETFQNRHNVPNVNNRKSIMEYNKIHKAKNATLPKYANFSKRITYKQEVRLIGLIEKLDINAILNTVNSQMFDVYTVGIHGKQFLGKGYAMHENGGVVICNNIKYNVNWKLILKLYAGIINRVFVLKNNNLL